MFILHNPEDADVFLQERMFCDILYWLVPKELSLGCDLDYACLRGTEQESRPSSQVTWGDRSWGERIARTLYLLTPSPEESR